MERIEYNVVLETKYLEVADGALTEDEKAFINAHPISAGKYCWGYEIRLEELIYDDDEEYEIEPDYSEYFVQVGVKWEQESEPEGLKDGVWKKIDEKDIISIDSNDLKFDERFEDYDDAEKCVEEYIKYINQQGSKFA